MPTPHLTAFASLKPSTLEAFVFRVVSEKLKDKLLSTEGNRFYPGRYHLTGETGILYTSLNEETALREIERHASRDALQGKLSLGKIGLQLQKVIDLTQASNLNTLGLSKDDLISQNYSLTQAISLHARKTGFDGLLVPSATGSGTNLIIFENNLGEGCSIGIESINEVQ